MEKVAEEKWPEGRPPRPPIQATATWCPTSSGRTKLIFRGLGPPALGVYPEQVWGVEDLHF